MKYSTSFIYVLFFTLLSFFAFNGKNVSNASTPFFTPKEETAFDRVIRTGTIRCAYVTRPPHIIIDPNTNKMSGIDHDIVEAIGKAADLKIEWVEEAGFGVFPENLNSGKEDMFCSMVLINAKRAKRVELTSPIEYLPLHAYAREDDRRFDGNLSKINNPSITAAVVDGTSQKAATISAFPKANLYALQNMSDNSEMIMGLVSGKADIVVLEDNSVYNYNKNNPEKKLRRIPADAPIRTYAEAFAVGKNEWALLNLINASLIELQGNGIIDNIIEKYNTIPGSILPAAKPYAPIKKQ